MSDYKKIEKIKPETLLSLALEVLKQAIEFEYVSGKQPFLMIFKNQKYYVYIKNISSAYFSDRDKTTRAQLPIKTEFNKIKKSPYPFIFLGYDGLNDVYICWNYHVAKERLNIGKSVSFYSRSYFQTEVKEGEFIRRLLKNGDMPVLFKRSLLIDFFEKINTFFPDKPIVKIDYSEKISFINNEDKFQDYLKTHKQLSNKTIKNYSNALSGRISNGIRNYFIPKLDSIFFINDLNTLKKLNINLFQTDEFKLLNETGKKMYSCAFDNYINFIIKEKSFASQTTNNFQEDENSYGKLSSINNIVIINEIKLLIESNRILSAAQIVGNYYKNQYPNMELSDWINLVRKIK